VKLQLEEDEGSSTRVTELNGEKWFVAPGINKAQVK